MSNGFNNSGIIGITGITGQQELLDAYPEQSDIQIQGTKVYVYPHALPGTRLVGRLVRYDLDQVISRPPRIIVRIGTRFFLTNIEGQTEFIYGNFALATTVTSDKAAERVKGLLPAQDLRFLGRTADIVLPGTDGRFTHGRYVRCDATEPFITLIEADGPPLRIFTDDEIPAVYCTGAGGCLLNSPAVHDTIG